MIHELCVSKTGVLTSGIDNVTKFHFSHELKSRDNELVS